MIIIENTEYKDYELKLDYKYDEIDYKNSIEDYWIGFMYKVRITHNDKKKVIITPVFKIKTMFGSKLYDYLDWKKNNMFDPVTGHIGFKRDYVFDLTFDDKFDSSDSGSVCLYNTFVESYDIDEHGFVTFSIGYDYVHSVEGVHEFINYMGTYEIPKTFTGNYKDYIDIHNCKSQCWKLA